jgi:DeoR/GlpR family transcriptional regulator of sugar metabolism
VGPCAIRTIESYLADRAFISVKGITPDGQLTDINPLEAEVKRAMIRQSERPVLLVDGRKVEQRGFSVIAHVSEVSLVLTADAGRAHVERLEHPGVEVRRKRTQTGNTTTVTSRPSNGNGQPWRAWRPT